MDYQSIIEAYQLEPLPEEGGYFSRVYEHDQRLGDGSTRRVASAIYFLITAEQFSAMHRLQADELFHFYHGHSCEMLQIAPDGEAQIVKLGHVFEDGEKPMSLVRGGTWQGMRLATDAPPGAYAFFGVSVHPAFEWDDFEISTRTDLCAQFPQCAEMICELTRD